MGYKFKYNDIALLGTDYFFPVPGMHVLVNDDAKEAIVDKVLNNGFYNLILKHNIDDIFKERLKNILNEEFIIIKLEYAKALDFRTRGFKGMMSKDAIELRSCEYVKAITMRNVDNKKSYLERNAFVGIIPKLFIDVAKAYPLSIFAEKLSLIYETFIVNVRPSKLTYVETNVEELTFNVEELCDSSRQYYGYCGYEFDYNDSVLEKDYIEKVIYDVDFYGEETKTCFSTDNSIRLTLHIKGVETCQKLLILEGKIILLDRQVPRLNNCLFEAIVSSIDNPKNVPNQQESWDGVEVTTGRDTTKKNQL